MMANYFIDINADLGEGLGNENDLMPYLSSCNIACGGHAGDLQTMTNVVQLAKTYDVKVGAHPSFPDRENFGRVVMELSEVDLYNSLKQQIEALQNLLYKEDVQLHHIKPHGALYNLGAKDEKTATIIVKVIKHMALPIKLYAPYNSVLAKQAKTEMINVVYEAFADRNYNEDLSLVSRKNHNAILTDKYEVLSHILEMIKYQKVLTIQGVKKRVKASTFCVHGDTENVVEILRFLSQELPENNIEIK